jgi:hypothetical protein
LTENYSQINIIYLFFLRKTNTLWVLIYSPEMCQNIKCANVLPKKIIHWECECIAKEKCQNIESA